MKKIFIAMTSLLLASHAWAFRYEIVSGGLGSPLTLTPKIAETATLIINPSVLSNRGTSEPLIYVGVNLDGAEIATAFSGTSSGYQVSSNEQTLLVTANVSVTAGNHTVTFVNKNAPSSSWVGGSEAVIALYPNEPGPFDTTLLNQLTDLNARVAVLEAAIPLIQNDITGLKVAVAALQDTVAKLQFVTKVAQNLDGSITYTYRDGTTYSTTPDRLNPVVNIAQNSDGTLTYTYKDGTTATTKADTTNPIVSVASNPDGSFTYTYKNGTTTSVKPIAAVTGVKQNADGSLTFTYADGTTFTNSSLAVKSVSQNADGSITYTYSNGTTYTSKPTGLASVADNKNGTFTYLYADGKSMTTSPTSGITSTKIDGNGHLIITLSDGTTEDAGYVVGATGASGEAGAAGERGVAGKNGKSGINGRSGSDGNNGTWWPGVAAGVGTGALFWLFDNEQSKSENLTDYGQKVGSPSASYSAPYTSGK